MRIHEIHDLSNYYVTNLLLDFFATITEQDVIKNYHPKYYKNPANIFYILGDTRGRYKNHGKYYVIENQGKFICSAGWNEYTYDTTIALALTRAYVHPDYRAKYYMGKLILPRIIDQTQKYNKLYITVNDYNDTIYKYFTRVNESRSAGLCNHWPEIYKKFKPIGLKHIYHKDQYVVECVR